MKKAGCQVAVILAILILATPLLRADDKTIESYTASVVNPTGVTGGRPIPIKIFIYSYTPDEEVAQLAGILKKQGPDALSGALEKMSRGRIAPPTGTGSTVNYVRQIETEDGRILRMVLNRPIAFMEIRATSRSSDYSFGVVEIKIPKSGEMSGTLVSAARIQLNQNGTLELESFGIQPARLMSLNKMK